jgi:hypothetical protein
MEAPKRIKRSLGIRGQVLCRINCNVSRWDDPVIIGDLRVRFEPHDLKSSTRCERQSRAALREREFIAELLFARHGLYLDPSRFE